MFAGHLGLGLMLKPASRELRLGALLFSALFLDVVLWLLVLAGVESVRVPPDLKTMADLRFDVPYSHSLLASVGWSVFFALGWVLLRRSLPRILSAAILAGLVFSHFILDW